MLPTRAQLAEQLTRVIDVRLLDPLEILLDDAGTVTGLRTLVRTRAAAWAATMLGEDDAAAVAAIMRVAVTLHPADGPFAPPADWWASPMGRMLAYRAGHPTAESVPYPVAGAMLGITRQAVHDLVTRGKLQRHPDGGVVPSSVRARLRLLNDL